MRPRAVVLSPADIKFSSSRPAFPIVFSCPLTAITATPPQDTAVSTFPPHRLAMCGRGGTAVHLTGSDNAVRPKSNQFSVSPLLPQRVSCHAHLDVFAAFYPDQDRQLAGPCVDNSNRVDTIRFAFRATRGGSVLLSLSVLTEMQPTGQRHTRVLLLLLLLLLPLPPSNAPIRRVQWTRPTVLSQPERRAQYRCQIE
jgi:hypothetical protein